MPKKESTPKSAKEKSSKNPNVALRYSGMAFQMIAIIGVITFIGVKVNDYFGAEPPYITAIFALLSIFAALYLTLKDLIFPKK